MAVLEITADNFQKEVTESKKPVLVDFWAPWCAPCRMQGPVIEEAARSYGDRAVFAKLNVDEQQELAMRYEVMSIPSLIVFKDGKATVKKVGFTPLEEIAELIAR